jgi:hypothetical protein
MWLLIGRVARMWVFGLEVGVGCLAEVLGGHFASAFCLVWGLWRVPWRRLRIFAYRLEGLSL